jgi:uncharacterized protein YhaN
VNRLTITGVSDIKFAGHNGTSLAIPNSPFVVIRGNNEAGKSSLAEVISWLIAGPSGDAKHSQRFGDPESVIGGRLRGNIDSIPLDIVGKFGVARRGAARDEIAGTIGGDAVTRELLAGRLGGISSNEFDLIYRFDGVNLQFTGGDFFEGQLSRFAMGNAGDAIDYRARATELSSQVASYTRQIEACRTELNRINGDIAALRRLPGEIETVRRQIEELEQERTKLQKSQDIIYAEKSIVDTVLASLPILAEVQRAQAERDSLEPVPAHWMAIASQLPELRDAFHNLSISISQWTSAEHHLAEESAASGADRTLLVAGTWSPDRKQQLRQVAELLKDASADHRVKVETLAKAQADLQDVQSHARVQATGLGVSVETLAGHVALIESLETIKTSAETASADYRSVSELEAQISELDTQFAATQTASRTSGDAQVKKPLLTGALGLLAVSVALMFVNRIASAIGVVVSIGLVALSMRGNSAESAPETTSDATPLRAMLQSKQQSVARALDQVFQVTDQFNVGRPSAFTAPALVKSLKVAVDAAAAVSKAQQLVANAETAERVSRQSFENAQKQYREIFASFNCAEVGLTEFPAWIDKLDNAFKTAQSFTTLEAECKLAAEQLAARLGTLAQELPVTNPAAALSVLAKFEERLKVIEAADATLRGAKVQLAASLQGKAAAQELINSNPSEEKLKDRLQGLSSDGDALKDRVVHITENISSLDATLREKENNDQLLDLNRQVADLQESIDELVHQQAVAAVAAAHLSRIIDKFERENQDPLIQKTQAIVNTAADTFGSIILRRENGKPVVLRDRNGVLLSSDKLSGGAKTLSYLALRLAFANEDMERRQVSLPILCDDSMVTVDHERRKGILGVLAQASEVRQVILFTFDNATASLARDLGAQVVEL